MMQIERDTLIKLRDAVIQNNDNGIDALRESGYAGGNSLFDAFANWAREKHGAEVTQLSLQDFSKHCAEFWREAGWGDLTVKDGENNIAVAEVANCWEASDGSDRTDGDGGGGGGDGHHEGCHIT